MQLWCSEHKNKIERVCLNKQCQNKIMCLYCEHVHGTSYQSIMHKKSENYQTFTSIINQAVDRYFCQLADSTQEKIKQKQFQILKSYFKDLKRNFQDFLDETESIMLKKMQSQEEDSLLQIRNCRINRNYLTLPSKIFQIVLQVYEGMTFEQVLQSTQTLKTQEALAQLQQFHLNCSSLTENNHYQLKTKFPDFRQAYLQNDSEIELKDKLSEQSYQNDDDLNKNKYQFEQNCIFTSNQFDSIVTDCIKISNEEYMMTNYDKKLRIFNQKVDIVAEFEYNNILNAVYKIGEDTYAIAKSKQLLIEKIREQKKIGNQQEWGWRFENILKLTGHKERINGLHSLNTRIIGSSSNEGVKLWDLYKEKCEYTFKEEGNPTCLHFLPKVHQIAIGFNNHAVSVYSIETLKLIRKYALEGTPILLDQGNCHENIFYVGGFFSQLSQIDTRLPKLTFSHKFQSDAISTLTESVHNLNSLCLGDRSGQCILFDFKLRKSLFTWSAHQGKSNAIRPNGVVKIFQGNTAEQYLTVGAIEKNIKKWKISKKAK